MLERGAVDSCTVISFGSTGIGQKKAAAQAQQPALADTKT
jgi:hypothetical protein